MKMKPAASPHFANPARQAVILCLALSLSCVDCPAAGEPVRVAQSGPERTSLLELYTSEGCSSCPPAEKWLASLIASEGLWKDVVPVVFHVDYWDYLGWKDALAAPAYTARQRDYAREWNTSTVYTPGFVLNGRDWRGRELPVAAEGRAPGRLVVDRLENDEFRIAFTPEGKFQGGQVQLALLGFGHQSQVRAGENSGRELRHDFVVLSLTEAPLVAEAGPERWSATVKLPPRESRRLAVAAWISAANSPSPLQAAGGWLNEKL